MAYGEYGQNLFTGMIDENGTIYEAGTGRKRQAVGIDIQKEQEYLKTIADMQEVIDEYYAKLVELGVIQIPKTQEQLAQEQLQLAQEQARQQAEINNALLDAINGLKTELEDMKNGNAGSRNAIGINENGSNSTSGGKKSAGGPKRNTAGTENPSSDS